MGSRERHIDSPLCVLKRSRDRSRRWQEGSVTNVDIAVAMTVATEKGGGALLPRVKSGEEKIYVTVRVRPLSGKEIARSDVSDWECTNDNTIAFKHALPERSPFPAAYTFGKYDVVSDQQWNLQFDLLYIYLDLIYFNFFLWTLFWTISNSQACIPPTLSPMVYYGW